MMTYSVTYDSNDHCIVITHQGPIDMSVINESSAEAARLAKQYNCFSILADLRAATAAVATMDIFDLPNTTSERLSTEGLQIYRFKRALVVAQEFDDPSFFETISRKRGHNVRLFHT